MVACVGNAVLGLLLGAALLGSAACTTPAVEVTTTDTAYDVGVLAVSYYPLTPDGQNIDIGVTGDVGGAASTVKAHVAALMTALPRDLSNGTRYRGHVDPSAPPALTYHVVDSLEFDTAVPKVASTLNPAYPYRADYRAMFSSFPICDYVRDKGVREVWMWAYQGPHQLDISESKMSGPHGDVSNSYRLDDLPHCGRTYTVYTFNYGREVAEAVHSYGHQLEAELAFVDPHLFTDLFEGPVDPGVTHAMSRCGSDHNPPNSRADYDYVNPAQNLSDCDAWLPEGTGVLSSIGCATWSCTADFDVSQERYLVWWMQHFPGRGNRLSYQGRPMRNWWDVHGDFDAVVEAGKSLTR